MNSFRLSLVSGIVLVLFFSPVMSVSLAQSVNDVPNMFEKAKEHFMEG